MGGTTEGSGVFLLDKLVVGLEKSFTIPSVKSSVLLDGRVFFVGPNGLLTVWPMPFWCGPGGSPRLSFWESEGRDDCGLVNRGGGA